MSGPYDLVDLPGGGWYWLVDRGKRLAHRTPGHCRGVRHTVCRLAAPAGKMPRVEQTALPASVVCHDCLRATTTAPFPGEVGEQRHRPDAARSVAIDIPPAQRVGETVVTSIAALVIYQLWRWSPG